MSDLVLHLKARVTQLISGATKKDKKPRAIVKFEGAAYLADEIEIVNDCGLELDQELTVIATVNPLVVDTRKKDGQEDA